MKFTQRINRQHKILLLEGALDIYTAPGLKKEIHKIIDEGVDSLVVDMVHINLLDSSGIALLANIKKRLQSEEKQFYLMNVQSDVMVILKLSSLDNFFQILTNETDLP